ncbi:MAG: divergent polysaccharide deacetylase family protein [Candidatus Omnitrophota bacterium]|nr:divergent polysaccharide deacetylase family protein [Candidatus Omnitrophota bacterium]
MKRNVFYNLIVILAAVICLLVGFNLATSVFQNKALDKVVSSELARNKIFKRDLVGRVKHVYIEKRYWVSDSFPFEDFGKALENSLEKAGFHLLSVSKSSKVSVVAGKKEVREEISYLISERAASVPIFRLTLIRKVPYRLPPVTKVPPPVKAKPKVAIVLDDWGYNIKNLNGLLEIDKPMTLSILPGLPYSTFVANKAKEHNFEVILHMPMEPKAKMRLELSTLYITMRDDEIRSNLAKALESVLYAKGISNHEGSKATEDRRLMRAVFGKLKEDNLFFLDSLVTNDSVCEPLAREMKVRFAKRDIFLDNESNPAYIRKQFGKLIDLAVKNGEAVGIGHDRPNTLAVLKEMIPQLEEKGVELTYISDLAR